MRLLYTVVIVVSACLSSGSSFDPLFEFMQAAKFQFHRILEIHTFDWNYFLQRVEVTIARNCTS